MQHSIQIDVELQVHQMFYNLLSIPNKQNTTNYALCAK